MYPEEDAHNLRGFMFELMLGGQPRGEVESMPMHLVYDMVQYMNEKNLRASGKPVMKNMSESQKDKIKLWKELHKDG